MLNGTVVEPVTVELLFSLIVPVNVTPVSDAFALVNVKPVVYVSRPLAVILPLVKVITLPFLVASLITLPLPDTVIPVIALVFNELTVLLIFVTCDCIVDTLPVMELMEFVIEVIWLLITLFCTGLVEVEDNAESMVSFV